MDLHKMKNAKLVLKYSKNKNEASYQVTFPIYSIDYLITNNINNKTTCCYIIHITSSYSSSLARHLMMYDCHMSIDYIYNNRERTMPVVIVKYIENAYDGVDIMMHIKENDSPQIFIDKVWYNDPYTTVQWDDGTTITSKCSKGETFSKEIGVAMCIAKKYFVNKGVNHPRKVFKYIVDHGVDLKDLHYKRDKKKMIHRATNMVMAGYSIDEIKKTLGMSDEDVAEWKKIVIDKISFPNEDKTD